MLTGRDLVSTGPPHPPSPALPAPQPLSASSLLSSSDPQALNDFLHGSEKVSECRAGRRSRGWG